MNTSILFFLTVKSATVKVHIMDVVGTMPGVITLPQAMVTKSLAQFRAF